jgi:hypothetical protein
MRNMPAQQYCQRESQGVFKARFQVIFLMIARMDRSPH